MNIQPLKKEHLPTTYPILRAMGCFRPPDSHSPHDKLQGLRTHPGDACLPGVLRALDITLTPRPVECDLLPHTTACCLSHHLGIQPRVESLRSSYTGVVPLSTEIPGLDRITNFKGFAPIREVRAPLGLRIAGCGLMSENSWFRVQG